MAVSTSTPELFDALVDELVAKVIEGVVAAMATVEPVEPWRLLNVREVAAMLGRSPRWVHGAVKERELPYVRLDGGALMFDREQVIAWAKARSIPRQNGSTCR